MSNRISIGNITSGYRPIENGLKYEKYFKKPENRDRIIIEDGEVEQTVNLMKKVVWKYIDDTKKIAPILKGSNVYDTCINVWNFLYHNIQYRLDKRGLEQLRRPARSWYERKDGIDCDCFSIFASSILTNLGIKHSFRITKYGQDVFQHVYVIVPQKNDLLIIDPVLSRANYQKPYTEKKDFPMSLKGINVAVLSGINDGDLYNAVMATDLEGFGLGDSSTSNDTESIYNYLLTTRNAVANNPDIISTTEDPKAFLKMLDYALKYWNTPQRDKALRVLSRNEDKLNIKAKFSGIEDDMTLGSIFRKNKNNHRKGFFKNTMKAVKSAGKGIKKIGKAMVRYNPVSIAARNGFLLALKLNIKKMSSYLKWAYATNEQAKRKGISTSYQHMAKEALHKVEKLFVDKLQGTPIALKNAILKGRGGSLSGSLDGFDDLSGLGDPVSATAAAAMITTATPIIIAVVKIIKDSGLMNKSESEIVNVSEGDIQALVNNSNPDPEIINSDPSITPYTDKRMPNNENGNTGNGFMSFIKNNPLVAVGGVATVSTLGFFLFGKKKSKKTGLRGAPTTRKKAPNSSGKTVKTIKLS